MLGLLKLVLILGTAGFFVWRSFKFGKDSRGDTTFNVNIGTILAGFLLAGMVGIGTSSIGELGPRERGLVTRFGAITGRVLEPGLYMVTPLVESVTPIDVSVQKEEVVAAAVSKDLQQVSTKVALNFYPESQTLASLYRTVGSEYKGRIIDPAIQEAVKSTTAKFNADSLIANRHTVKNMMENELKARLIAHNIAVEAVNITDFRFSPEFTAAIEAKVTSTQQALKAKNDLERVKFEADQSVATARAQAEAIRIQAEAIQSQGGKEYVSLKAIEKWDGSVPQYMMGAGSFVPFIDITPKK